MALPSPFDGRYQLLREVGAGAMGAVYQALDTRLDRTVAIKTIRLASAQDEFGEFLLRFDREARSTGRLNHPNVVTVYDSGVADDVAYIAMEFLTGQSLDRRLASGYPVAVPEAIDIVRQVAQALAYAHGQGVVHRDVKPGNIVLLDNGLVKLTDFGIAQLANAEMTQTGVILGTPKYMSPEQIAGSRVDGRADVFSLGVVLYELLTGRAPFRAPTLVSMMHSVIHSAPELPTSLAPSIPASVVSILARCLMKAPDRRYPSAQSLVDDPHGYADLVPDVELIAEVFDPPAPRVTEGFAPAAMAPECATMLTASWPRGRSGRSSQRIAAMLAGVSLILVVAASTVPPTPASTVSPRALTGATPIRVEPTPEAPPEIAPAESPRSGVGASISESEGVTVTKKPLVRRPRDVQAAQLKPRDASAWTRVKGAFVQLYTEPRDCLRYGRCRDASASRPETPDKN